MKNATIMRFSRLGKRSLIWLRKSSTINTKTTSSFYSHSDLQRSAEITLVLLGGTKQAMAEVRHPNPVPPAVAEVEVAALPVDVPQPDTQPQPVPADAGEAAAPALGSSE